MTLEVIVPAYDDGTGQLISAKQISDLTVFMNKSFASSNIEWKLETRLIQNDTIRRSLVMFDCRPEQIGMSGKTLNHILGLVRKQLMKAELCSESLDNVADRMMCSLDFYILRKNKTLLDMF